MRCSIAGDAAHERGGAHHTSTDFPLRCDRRGVRSVESHGTGTKLGDPTEVNALARALDVSSLLLSGIKANAGHLEPAAGMLGLQTLLLVVRWRRAAPNAHLR